MPKTVPKPSNRPTKQRARVQEKSAINTARGFRPELWIYLALVLATFAIYSQVAHFDFVNFDDPDYVTANPHVRAGITADGVEWAFTSGEAANWFPLTRISHMLDVQLFGLQSGWHHGVNLLLHVIATLLLFAFLHRATQALWPSAFVAFLFALHPMHVESVAWVAERKDVLSALFWFLALWAYVRYVERPSRGRYLFVVAAFGLGLMSKPMIVTLPFVLLLLDFWPLRRQRSMRLVWEKMPLFALSAVVAVITFLVQRGSGAVREVVAFPVGLRIENALVSYALYVGQTFIPARLAVFYPYPQAIPVWQLAAAALLIAGVTVFVLRRFRDATYLAVGWFWFLGTLLPVIGLVQVGAQARADRYMYVPMIGLTIMLAWGAMDVFRNWPGLRTAVAGAGISACCCLAVVTWFQTRYWKNSEALFQHALEVTDPNYLAEHNLGSALLDVPGRLPDAVHHLEAALRIQPDSARAHTDLGIAFSKIPGRAGEAVAQYEAALRVMPDSAISHNDLGITLSKIPGRLPDAIAQYQSALRINPDYAEAHNNLGLALSETPGRFEDAIPEYEAALRIRPDYAEAHANLGAAFSQMPGSAPDAIAQYDAAMRLGDDSAALHYNLGVALSKIEGRVPDAIAQFEAALRLEPSYAEAHNNLGVALAQLPGRADEAIKHFEAALRINPDYADAHVNLGVALSAIPGRAPEAIRHFEAALRIKPDPEVRQALDRMRAAERIRGR